MKCELLAEQNLALMLDFVDDENTKYDEAVLKAFLNEKNAYGYLAAEDGKAIGFAYGYVLHEPDGQKVCILKVLLPRYSHWVLFYYGKYYDPEFGLMDKLYCKAKIQSYLELFPD